MVADSQTPDRDPPFGGLAYDLLNVLAVIKANVQLLRRRVGRTDHPETERIVANLEHIDAHAVRMTGLIDTLHRGNRPGSEASMPSGPASPPRVGPLERKSSPSPPDHE